LWFAMTVVTLLGAAWAWRRHFRSATGEKPIPEAPQRTELFMLGLLSVACLGLVVFCLFEPLKPFEGNLLLVLTFAVWAGALYRTYVAVLAPPRAVPRLVAVPPLAAEPAPVGVLIAERAEHVRPGEAVPVVLPVSAPPTVTPARRARRAALPTEGVMLWAA